MRLELTIRHRDILVLDVTRFSVTFSLFGFGVQVVPQLHHGDYGWRGWTFGLAWCGPLMVFWPWWLRRDRRAS